MRHRISVLLLLLGVTLATSGCCHKRLACRRACRACVPCAPCCEVPCCAPCGPTFDHH